MNKCKDCIHINLYVDTWDCSHYKTNIKTKHIEGFIYVHYNKKYNYFPFKNTKCKNYKLEKNRKGGFVKGLTIQDKY